MQGRVLSTFELHRTFVATQRKARESGVRASFGLLGWSGIAVAAGITIACIQLVPMLDYFEACAAAELEPDARAVQLVRSTRPWS